MCKFIKSVGLAICLAVGSVGAEHGVVIPDLMHLGQVCWDRRGRFQKNFVHRIVEEEELTHLVHCPCMNAFILVVENTMVSTVFCRTVQKCTYSRAKRSSEQHTCVALRRATRKLTSSSIDFFNLCVGWSKSKSSEKKGIRVISCSSCGWKMDGPMVSTGMQRCVEVFMFPSSNGWVVEPFEILGKDGYGKRAKNDAWQQFLLLGFACK